MKIKVPSLLARIAIKILPPLGKRSELKFWSIVGFGLLLLVVALITIIGAWHHNPWFAILPWFVVLGAFGEKIYKRLRHGHFRCGVCDHDILATEEAEGDFGPHPHPDQKGERMRACKKCACAGKVVLNAELRHLNSKSLMQRFREVREEDLVHEIPSPPPTATEVTEHTFTRRSFFKRVLRQG